MGPDNELINRIDTALDRIARGLEKPDPVAAEVATRLDQMIARLRDGLED